MMQRKTRLALLVVLAMSLVCAPIQTALAYDGDPVLAAEISNEYLSIMVGTNGHVISGGVSDGVAGSPKSPISYGWNYQDFWCAYTTVKIDGGSYMYGESGDVIKAPTNGADLTNESIWQIGDIQAKQTLQIVKSDTGNADTGLYKYTVTNTGAVSHEVGLRTMFDYDGMYHSFTAHMSDGPVQINSKEYLGQENMPQYWQVTFNNGNNAYCTLAGAGASTPDRLVFFGAYRMLYRPDGMWDWLVGYGPAFGPITGMFWNPTTLAPGQTREYVFYYGLGKVSTPEPTTEVLSELVESYCTNSGVVNSLKQQLASIQQAIDSGNANAQAGKVKAFINHVKAQTGKSITAENAATLIDLVGKVK